MNSQSVNSPPITVDPDQAPSALMKRAIAEVAGERVQHKMDRKSRAKIPKVMTKAQLEKALPNGCPVFPIESWEGKKPTSRFEDVEWTHKHLGNATITKHNIHKEAPSLSCAIYWWAVRYTREGFDDHQKQLQKILLNDKNYLRDMKKRQSDAKPREILTTILSEFDGVDCFDLGDTKPDVKWQRRDSPSPLPAPNLFKPEEKAMDVESLI